MKLKASLHIHTREDKKDGHMINYSVYQLIDEAKKNGFDVLGYTPHQKFVFRPEYAEYARKKGILLIPGVERNLGRILNKHVIVLNCDKSIEKVRNFKQLIKYKQEHPEVFILAPHPTYSRLLSIGPRNLKKYIDLFDAIEYSSLYSKLMNANRKAEKIAIHFHKPMIATADVHMLRKLKNDYAIIESEEFNIESVCQAIKNNHFENVTRPKRFFSVWGYIIFFNIKYLIRYIDRKILGWDVPSLEFQEELNSVSVQEN